MQVLRIASRECGILVKNPIYLFCMVLFPITVLMFFVSMMKNGQPVDMPVGVVDLDNTSTTHALVRKLDSFQSSHVVGHYATMSDARQAIQRNEIYAFIYFPEGTTEALLSSRQPKISFYYSYSSVTAGALLYRDLKTISTLGSAAVGQATMRAKGFTDKQISTFLQPIVVDLHPINNPWVNYNVYLSTMIVPGLFLLFIFLVTTYSIGTELKFNDAKQWMSMADNNIYIALTGKLLPQFLIFVSLFMFYIYYVFGHLGFPHPGGTARLVALSVLTVLAAQGFGVFAFGLFPSLRMSMSICSLWAMLSFTTAGSTFPIQAMDTPIQALAQLFPLRHYYMTYQICIFNGYPLTDALYHIGMLALFALLPLFVVHIIRKAMLEYVYIP